MGAAILLILVTKHGVKVMEIIKDKPMPPRRAGIKSKWNECDQMEVGDMVVVATRKEANAVVSWFRARGKKGLTRHVTEGGIGVWRAE